MAFVDLDDFLARARLPGDPVEGEERLSEGGDIEFLDADGIANIRRAAVLVPIIPREHGPTTLLTHRPMTMKAHPGQVAFPGGKVDPIDHDPVHAALREAHEEVGVDPAKVELVGVGDIYVAGSGFRITPVVAILPSDFVAIPEPYEVADVFETPLSFLMNPENHVRKSRLWNGKERHYLEMPHNGHYIWGVTAGVIRSLYDRLYAEGKDEA